MTALDFKSITLPKIEKPMNVIIGVLLICSISSYATYSYMKANYLEVHPSEVGGFVFQNGKVYNLCEINGFDVKMTVAKPSK